MAKQTIDTGTLELNGQDGDTNRDAADKINANFTELYNANENFVRGAGVVPGGALVVFAGTTGNQVAAASGGAPGSAAFRNATEFASAAQGVKADNAQAKLSPGDGILIDDTDPLNPIISATATGGGEVATVAGVEPFGGDIPAADLATALGVDNKLDSTATAAAATKLATSRNINGVAFDGTANITVADGTKEPAITGGTAGQYWNGLKAWADFATSVRASVLTGLSLATSTAVAAADSVLVAIGKLQAQVSLKLNADANAVSASKLNTARTINGVAFDGTANITLPASGAAWGGITGTLSSQTDLQAALDAKLNASLVGFAYVYPNGGNSASPASVAIGSRYTNPNPFPGFPIICHVELLISGVWETPGWFSNGESGGSGTLSTPRRGGAVDEIITATGGAGVASGSAFGGGSYNSSTLSSAPCRVKVWKVRS